MRTLKELLRDIFTKYYSTEVTYSDGCGKMTVYYAVPCKWFTKNSTLSSLELWKKAVKEDIAVVCDVRHY